MIQDTEYRIQNTEYRIQGKGKTFFSYPVSCLLSTIYCYLLPVTCYLLLLGCAFHEPLERNPYTASPPLREEEKNPETLEAHLRELSTSLILYLQEHQKEFEKEVITSRSGLKKYHYKYYDVFPEGPEGIQISLKETSSFTTPYEGTVTYRKRRFSTHYYKSKGKAKKDKDFIREEGIQKDIYIFQGSRWSLKYSNFMVETTSVFRDDKWVRAQGLSKVKEEKEELFMEKVTNFLKSL